MRHTARHAYDVTFNKPRLVEVVDANIESSPARKRSYFMPPPRWDIQRLALMDDTPEAASLGRRKKEEEGGRRWNTGFIAEPEDQVADAFKRKEEGDIEAVKPSNPQR